MDYSVPTVVNNDSLSATTDFKISKSESKVSLCPRLVLEKLSRARLNI
jgi:hypothetical protein